MSNDNYNGVNLGSCRVVRRSRRHAVAIRAVAVARLTVLLAASAMVAACSGSGTPLEVGAIGARQPAKVGAEEATVFRLSTGDKVRSVVFSEPSLSGEFTIDNRGKISYPLIGEVNAKGLTGPELERVIVAKLKGRYLVKPQVAIEIVAVRPVYVIGEVKSPGEYPFRPGLNVVSGIALAGGFAPRANSDVVYVKRLNEAAEQRYSDLGNVLVQPGDIIRVVERYF